MIRAHLAPTREQAKAEVREGREAERVGCSSEWPG